MTTYHVISRHAPSSAPRLLLLVCRWRNLLVRVSHRNPQPGPVSREPGTRPACLDSLNLRVWERAWRCPLHRWHLQVHFLSPERTIPEQHRYVRGRCGHPLQPIMYPTGASSRLLRRHICRKQQLHWQHCCREPAGRCSGHTPEILTSHAVMFLSRQAMLLGQQLEQTAQWVR